MCVNLSVNKFYEPLYRFPWKFQQIKDFYNSLTFGIIWNSRWLPDQTNTSQWKSGFNLANLTAELKLELKFEVIVAESHPQCIYSLSNLCKTLFLKV